MNTISKKDREILRELAKHLLGLANSKENEEVLNKWKLIERGEIGEPTVRFLVSNFTNETITSRLKCEGENARDLEFGLLISSAGRELFNDDTPLTGEFLIHQNLWVTPFNTPAKRISAEGENAKGYHIEPVINDLEEDFDRLTVGDYGSNIQETNEKIEFARDVFGDILLVKGVMGSLSGPITSPLVHLMGMQNYYLSMYDYPDLLHKVMNNACKIYEQFYDYLEDQGLLLPTAGVSPVAQESFAFNNELPKDRATKTTDCWGFLESQETTAVSSDTFAEFVFPYQDRLAKRFGLLSYGCCERVDDIWEHISGWENLRKLSVSPFNDERRVGEYLRGSNIVYYSKPRAEHVTIPGPLDEDAIIDCFKGIAEAASGCMLEVAQREVGTIFGDYNRGRRYVELAKQTIDKYWKH
ncbi:MAG TPA: hypothetical protein VFD89_09680 [Clostridia bacterium]|nr:hypothetical protein [Clostridia bacterium]